MKPGQKLEDETTKALKGVEPRCFYHNSNSWVPVCDKWGVFQGLGFLVECKEFGHTRLRLDRFSTNERNFMDAFDAAGGLVLVLVRIDSAGVAKLWACTWWDIQQFEAQEEQLRGKRPSSIPLAEGQRPDFFTEVTKFNRPHSLGRAWDLSALLAYAHQLHLEGVYPLRIFPIGKQNAQQSLRSGPEPKVARGPEGHGVPGESKRPGDASLGRNSGERSNGGAPVGAEHAQRCLLGSPGTSGGSRRALSPPVAQRGHVGGSRVGPRP